MKLLGRRICRPHRLQYMLNIETMISRMREYCKSVYGRMVCPLCRQRPGIDSYGFQGRDGGVDPFRSTPAFHAWACLNCHGYVLNRGGGIIPIDHLTTIRHPHAPAPYSVRDQEREIRDSIGGRGRPPPGPAQQDQLLWNRVISMQGAAPPPDDGAYDDIYD